MFPNLDYEMRLQEISGAKLSRLLGITRQAFNLKKNGKRAFTQFERRVIAKTLRKSIKWLFEV